MSDFLPRDPEQRLVFVLRLLDGCLTTILETPPKRLTKDTREALPALKNLDKLVSMLVETWLTPGDQTPEK